MKTTFTKEEIIKLLIEYYKRLEGRDVAVEITSKKECTGLDETETCVTTFTVIERFNIAGINKKVETVLSEEEVNTNMKALFSLYDFAFSPVGMDSSRPYSRQMRLLSLQIL